MDSGLGTMCNSPLSRCQDEEDEEANRRYDNEVAAQRLAERRREARRVAAAQENPDTKIFHRGCASQDPFAVQ